MSLADDMHGPLLARRIPREEIVLGRAYVIHARNGGVGVAVMDDGCLGYELHRVKFGASYLSAEWDWDVGPTFGTAIPLRALDVAPPERDDERLAWLAEREEECREDVEAAWAVVLGGPRR